MDQKISIGQRKNSLISKSSAWLQWELKTVLLFSLLVILGLVSLVISLLLKNVFWASVFSQISTALIISGLYTGISEMFLKRDFIETNNDNFQKLAASFHLAKEGESLGLETIIIDGESSYEQSLWIKEAQSLKIVMRDGKSWVSRNSEKLRQRFADPAKKTTILIIHPDSEILPIHASKLHSTLEPLQYKISETVAALTDLKTPNTQLEIKGHHSYITCNLLLTESHVIMSTYFTCKQRSRPPIFIFRDRGDNSYYQKLKQDIEAIEKESSDISTYVKK